MDRLTDAAAKGRPFSSAAAMKPEDGTVETTTATNFPGYPKENIRDKCNQHKVKGMQINYKSAEKYTGNDEFDLLILYPSGLAREDHFDIKVR